ncbi:MAG TPA: FAD-dependent oxidoreductase [Candidatus Eisenbergiella merdipullorum]|uniref:FAD-dependent oxidoreductase n=1 Tax=Candidatus Eisenbergiella merdipullorum TaxID=2838553 RepID=A0A9D2I6L8_9FIRM|nr:FAD-dependent oxidoreductase [Candidatus Eisenbergiella merdipullorum]
MVTISKMEKEILVSREVDVLVIGSGPAGSAAAINAARNGAKTLLVEYMSIPGGISTSGLMSHYTGTVDSSLYREVLQRMAEDDQMAAKGISATVIDPTSMTLAWIELLEESGAEMLFYTMACEAIVEDHVVKGVVIQNKSGRSAILSKVVIDATGDGDIAASAGVPYIKGRESDGAMQPATLMFKVAGVDMEHAVFPGSFETTVPTKKGELQALAKKLLPHPAGHVLLYKSTHDGIVTVNMTNAIGIDGTTAEGMTQAEITCRKQIPAIIEFLHEYVPGYENCYVISTASLIGIRETRHLKGLYTLTETDILERRQFEDYVVKGAEFNFDVHNMTGGSLDKTGVQAKFPKDVKYTIPYRCFVPEEIDGLLFAGRNISGTHMAHSNYRAMPICLAMGEAVGIAAAISVKKGIAPRYVNAAEIQECLAKDDQ